MVAPKQAPEWPDKAIISSLFLVVCGLAAWMQGLWILIGGYTAPFSPGTPTVWGLFSLAAGLLLFYAARSSSRQENVADACSPPLPGS